MRQPSALRDSHDREEIPRDRDMARDEIGTTESRPCKARHQRQLFVMRPLSAWMTVIERGIVHAMLAVTGDRTINQVRMAPGHCIDR